MLFWLHTGPLQQHSHMHTCMRAFRELKITAADGPLEGVLGMEQKSSGLLQQASVRHRQKWKALQGLKRKCGASYKD